MDTSEKVQPDLEIVETEEQPQVQTEAQTTTEHSQNQAKPTEDVTMEDVSLNMNAAEVNATDKENTKTAEQESTTVDDSQVKAIANEGDASDGKSTTGDEKTVSDDAQAKSVAENNESTQRAEKKSDQVQEVKLTEVAPKTDENAASKPDETPKSEPAKKPPSTTTTTNDQRNVLWISKLSNTAKASDLKSHFAPFGKVITAKIFTTRSLTSPDCFGCVTMESAESAALAKSKLDRTIFKGKVITVDMCLTTPGKPQPPSAQPKSSEPEASKKSEEKPVEKPPIEPVVQSPTKAAQQPAEPPKSPTKVAQQSAVSITTDSSKDKSNDVRGPADDDSDIMIIEHKSVTPAIPTTIPPAKDSAVAKGSEILSTPKVSNISPAKTADASVPSTKNSSTSAKEAAPKPSAPSKTVKKPENKVPIKAPEPTAKPSDTTTKETSKPPRSESKSRSHGKGQHSSSRPRDDKSPSRPQDPPIRSRINSRRTGGAQRGNTRGGGRQSPYDRQLSREIRSTADRFDRPKQARYQDSRYPDNNRYPDKRFNKERPKIRYDLDQQPRQPAYGMHRNVGGPQQRGHGIGYMHPASSAQMMNAVAVAAQQQQQQLYNQAEVMKIIQQNDALHLKREAAIERERHAIAIELEREKLAQERLQFELEKAQEKKIQAERAAAAAAAERERILAAQRAEYVAPKTAKTDPIRSPQKSSEKPRYSPTPYNKRSGGGETYSSRGSESNRYHESNRYASAHRSRSPHGRRSDSDRYYKDNSARSTSTRERRPALDSEYYSQSSSRSSRQQQAAPALGYGTSSSYATKPEASERESLKELAAAYEKRMTSRGGGGDAYGSVVASDPRTGAAYDTLGRSAGSYELSVSGRESHQQAAQPQYGSSSYATAVAEPASSSSYRYATEYAQPTASVSYAQQSAQHPTWSGGAQSSSYATAVEPSSSGWTRQSDWAASASAYDPNAVVQYQYVTRRF